jgi:hypothetical protein
MTASSPKRPSRAVCFVSALGGRSRLDMLSQRFSESDTTKTRSRLPTVSRHSNQIGLGTEFRVSAGVDRLAICQPFKHDAYGSSSPLDWQLKANDFVAVQQDSDWANCVSIVNHRLLCSGFRYWRLALRMATLTERGTYGTFRPEVAFREQH